MIRKSKFLDYGFLLTLLAVPFIPVQGRIDIIGPQFLFMSISLLVYISLKVIFSKQIILNLNLSHKFFIGFIGRKAYSQNANDNCKGDVLTDPTPKLFQPILVMAFFHLHELSLFLFRMCETPALILYFAEPKLEYG